MYALLDNNPLREISWKGKTLNQITSAIQKNNPVNQSASRTNIFRAMPLKLYRREIAANLNNSFKCSNSRVSSSINELNRPGGYVILNAANGLNLGGLVNVLETSAPSSKHETYGCGSSAAKSYTCAEQNAKRRCRSSGIIKRVYDPARSELSYFTNTNQYLVSRSKSFSQNQYRHVRMNDVSIVTNPLESKEMYSPNGISHCPKATIKTAVSFSYYWIDGTGPYTVNIPPGNYDVHDLNIVFHATMHQNSHYVIYTPTHEEVFLMKFIYNNTNEKVEIQAFTSESVNTPMYTIPITGAWSFPLLSSVGVFYFPLTEIQNIVGFSSGYYPPTFDPITNPHANISNIPVGFLSNLSHTIYPSYTVMYYKPSNNRFATQGGVSSSDMTGRLKYETITRNSLLTSAALGSQVGNAMAYGVSESVYTAKNKMAYPVPTTPVIDKYTGEIKCVANGRLVGRCASAPNG